MNPVNANKIGLVVGGLLAIFHAIWALMVLIRVAKPFMDWLLGLHFMALQYSITPFGFGRALLLVIVTGIIGYVMGFVLGWLWNAAHRSAHVQ